MNRHKFNIFPEMLSEDYSRLINDLKNNGYDESQPIYIFEDAILDGWNRMKACDELGITPTKRQFIGSEIEAIEFVMRTNKRRNLTSSQWAAIAAEADELWEVLVKQVEEERRRKQAETLTNTHAGVSGNLLPKTNYDENKASQKIADSFNTNRTYVSDAKKYRETNPEIFESIKRGDKSIAKVKNEEKLKKLKQEYRQKDFNIDKKPEITLSDCSEYLNNYSDNSIDLLITDPPYVTDVEDINEFANWITLAIRKVKPTGRAYVCIGAYPKEVKAYFDILLNQDKFIIDNPLIWTYRNTLGVTPKMKYNLNYQMILHLYSKDSKELDTSITNEMFSVQDINAPDGRRGNRLHTWQKPDELARRLIKHGSVVGDVVVDCFACTGTFLIEAVKQGRNGYGCDIDVDNLQIAKDRGCIIHGM